MLHTNHRAVGALLLLGALTAGASLANAATNPMAPSAVDADATPSVTIAQNPELTVAIRSKSAVDAPAVWVTFRTTERLANPRLVISQVSGHSGRTFRVRDRSTCLRTTVVTDTGRIDLRAGRRYNVKFYARAGIGRSRPRTLITTRTLVARGLRTEAGTHAPSCSSSNAATSSGSRYIGKRLVAKPEQLLFYENPAKSYIGSLQRGQSFRVRKLSPTGRYAYGLAYGRLNKTGWVKTAGLR